MNKLGKSFDIYVQKYDHLLLIGYFNLENLSNLSNTPICFKNPESPSCIDLLLTNSKTNFDEALV